MWLFVSFVVDCSYDGAEDELSVDVPSVRLGLMARDDCSVDAFELIRGRVGCCASSGGMVEVFGVICGMTVRVDCPASTAGVGVGSNSGCDDCMGPG